MLGAWKASSVKWLRELVAALEARHAEAGGAWGSRPRVLWNLSDQ